MKSTRRKPSGREKDEASIELLDRLSEQLHSSNPSIRRQAAFHLSWLQEDGLEILQEALFGDCPARSKNAAAYGLRKMRGRMQKMALEVFGQGIHYPNGNTRDACKRALAMMGKKPEGKAVSQESAPTNLEIREIRPKRRPERRIIAHQKPRRLARDRGSS